MKKLIIISTLLFVGISFGQNKNTPVKTEITQEVKKDNDNVEKKYNSVEPVSNAVIKGDDEIYEQSEVEVKAEYPGGLEVMNAYLKSNFKVPENLIGSNLECSIYISFKIEKDGSLTDPRILRECAEGFGKELSRVISLMPKWNPAIQNGNKVKSSTSVGFKVKT